MISAVGAKTPNHWAAREFPHPLKIQQCVQVDFKFPNYPFASPFPLVTISLFSKSAVVAQLPSHVRFCSPVDCSPPGSSVHGVFQQEYWIGVSFPTHEDFPNSGTEPMSPESPALAG